MKQGFLEERGGNAEEKRKWRIEKKHHNTKEKKMNSRVFLQL